MHNQYTSSELPDFWKDTALGNKLEETLKQDILIAKKYHFKCVVVHMLGSYSKIGEERLLRILDFCELNKIPIAIENIDHNEVFFEIFKRINHSYLKFCYDSGHNNWEIAFLCILAPFFHVLNLENFKDKLICMHLPDNMGQSDEHTLNRFGNINWNKIAQTLATINTENISLDYEMIMHTKNGTSMEECVTETYKQAVELENLIEKYKKEC